jgi:hypothetical protein
MELIKPIVVMLVVAPALWFIYCYLLAYLVTGSIFLLKWAVELGFVGFSVYIIFWIFLFPFMLVVCTLLGAYGFWLVRPNN